MCGQLGFSGNKKFDPNKIKILMYINAIERGLDATGLWSPLNKLDKSLVNGCGYAVSNWFKPKPDTILMSHVRAATIGDKKNVKNTHPFERGNYLLQHNGTLTNHIDLFDKYQLKKNDFHVDSDVIAGCIEKCDNIEEVLSQINGPAAIIIHDLRIKNRLYAFRNKERPLYYGITNEGMYISSVEESLILIQCKEIFEFDNDILYTIENGEIIDSLKIKNKPYTKPITYPIYGDYKLKLAIKCNIRAVNSFTVKEFGDKPSYEIIKDDYYLINDVDNLNRFNATNVKTGEIINVHSGNFNLNDTITADDYVMALSDIINLQQPTIKYLNKGDIVKVKTSFSDGDCSLYDKSETNFLCNLSKEFLRKLTYTELDEYLVSKKSILQLPIPFKCAEESASAFIENQKFLKSLHMTDSDGPNHDKPIDIVINDDNSLDENETESEDLEVIDIKKLDDHFTRTAHYLMVIQNLMNYEDTPLPLRNKIKVLITINDKAKQRFTEKLKIN